MHNKKRFMADAEKAAGATRKGHWRARLAGAVMASIDQAAFRVDGLYTSETKERQERLRRGGFIDIPMKEPV